mmetsp:Transcript_40684/g.39288  ORF Transcript_40684/g.39288 Transcript_40684/m.39288 type:complete len:85 (+) Transcript_40684:364-618(+)
MYYYANDVCNAGVVAGTFTLGTSMSAFADTLDTDDPCYFKVEVWASYGTLTGSEWLTDNEEFKYILYTQGGAVLVLSFLLPLIA